MKKEEEERDKDDIADEIIVGVNYPEIKTINSSNFSEFDKTDVEMRLFDGKQSPKNVLSSKFNTYTHSNIQEPFEDNDL
jgi:hypothetical protein